MCLFKHIHIDAFAVRFEELHYICLVTESLADAVLPQMGKHRVGLHFGITLEVLLVLLVEVALPVQLALPPKVKILILL